MKKMVFVIALAICCLVSMNVSAQNGSEEYKKELWKYMEASGSSATFTPVFDQVFMMMGSTLTGEKKAEVQQKALEQLIDLMVPVYQRNIPLEDLKEATRFYATPAGKRLAEAQPKIVEGSMQVGQQWAMSLQSMIQKAAAGK